MVFLCYELSVDSNAIFLFFILTDGDIYVNCVSTSWLGYSCTFQVFFIIKIVVATELPLKPSPQLARISRYKAVYF